MEIITSKNKISLDEMAKMSEKMYGNLVKAVVDIKKEIMAIDAPMHADEEQLLLENDSKQEDLWGINLYPEKYGSNDFIEFDSMINIRPSQNNRTRGVDDPAVQNIIRKIIEKLVTK